MSLDGGSGEDNFGEKSPTQRASDVVGSILRTIYELEGPDSRLKTDDLGHQIESIPEPGVGHLSLRYTDSHLVTTTNKDGKTELFLANGPPDRVLDHFSNDPSATIKTIELGVLMHDGNNYFGFTVTGSHRVSDIVRSAKNAGVSPTDDYEDILMHSYDGILFNGDGDPIFVSGSRGVDPGDFESTTAPLVEKVGFDAMMGLNDDPFAEGDLTQLAKYEQLASQIKSATQIKF